MSRFLSNPSTRRVAQGHLAILAANIIFGANIPIAKAVMPAYMEAYAMAFFRTAGAMALFWLASLFVRRERVPGRDLVRLFFAAVFGILLNQMLFVKGLEYISPIEAAIVVTFTPILTMLLSALFLKEPITFKKALGVLLGLSGAVYMIVSSARPTDAATAAEGSRRIIGLTLCIVSGLSYAIYLTAFKPVIQRYRSITIMKWMFLFGTCLSLPLTFRYVQRIDFQVWQPFTYVQTGYVVAAATFLTYLLIPLAQQRLRPTTLSVYNYTQPITATTIALVWGLDHFTWPKVIATALVFTGVYIVTQSKSRAQLEAERQAS
ncbi:MAG: DMT family transporter [Bacteroidales bacterium]|nr:DMT family transporter [Bacteroidales bacterium]